MSNLNILTPLEKLKVGLSVVLRMTGQGKANKQRQQKNSQRYLYRFLCNLSNNAGDKQAELALSGRGTQGLFLCCENKM